MRYVYIKRSQEGKYIEFNEPLRVEDYNNLSRTNSWEDYLDDKWILLSSDQIAFHEEHPEASVRKVWSMLLRPEHTLELARLEKLTEIEEFDKSENVNSFTLNGVSMWLTVEERELIASQISAHENIGRTEMTRWFNGLSFTFPLENWKQMLIALEIYAGDALNITEMHKANVNNLETIEEIDNYNYRREYPHKLEF